MPITLRDRSFATGRRFVQTTLRLSVAADSRRRGRIFSAAAAAFGAPIGNFGGGCSREKSPAAAARSAQRNSVEGWVYP